MAPHQTEMNLAELPSCAFRVLSAGSFWVLHTSSLPRGAWSPVEGTQQKQSSLVEVAQDRAEMKQQA